MENTKISDETSEIVTVISDEFDLSNIPEYTGNPYVEVNQNVPYFTENELSKTSYEDTGGVAVTDAMFVLEE